MRPPRKVLHKNSIVLAVTLCLALSFCAAPPKKLEVTASPDLERRFALPSQEPEPSILDHYLEKLSLDPQNPALHREVGTYYQVFSQPDRWDYVALAIEHLETAVEGLPEDTQALMYLGLAKASYAKGPKVPLFSKAALAREAFHSMDHAVALDTENFCLRLIRAKAQLLAPSILGRNKTMKEDHAWVVAHMENNRNLPQHYLMLGRIFLGDYAQKWEKDANRAAVYWRKVAQSDSAFAHIARDRLRGDWTRF